MQFFGDVYAMRGVERLLLVLVSFFTIYLGYMLYRNGHVNGTGKMSVESDWAKIAVSGQGPGLFFMTFGSLIARSLVFAAVKTTTTYDGNAKDIAQLQSRNEAQQRLISELQTADLETQKVVVGLEYSNREVRELIANVETENKLQSDQYLTQLNLLNNRYEKGIEMLRTQQTKLEDSISGSFQKFMDITTIFTQPAADINDDEVDSDLTDFKLGSEIKERFQDLNANLKEYLADQQ